MKNSIYNKKNVIGRKCANASGTSVLTPSPWGYTIDPVTAAQMANNYSNRNNSNTNKTGFWDGLTGVINGISSGIYNWNNRSNTNTTTTVEDKSTDNTTKLVIIGGVFLAIMVALIMVLRKK